MRIPIAIGIGGLQAFYYLQTLFNGLMNLNNDHMITFKNQKTIIFLLVGFISLVLFSACANKEVVDACLEGHTYGFSGGLLHGIIAPFDLVAMLFRDDVTVYAQNNNGAWYAFGFIIGSGGWGILGSKGADSKRRRRKC